MSERPAVAVYGGSFNPLHVGHVAIVRALAAEPSVARVVVVPARRSPFKTREPLLPDALRWEMLRAGLGGIPAVTLSDLELRRPPPSYSVDTLQTLAAQVPGLRLCFALGWDAYAEFARWYRADAILALAELIVFHRRGSDTPPAMQDWVSRLPAPWRAQARCDGAQRLVDTRGRTLVRRLPIALPAVAARELRHARTLDGVAPGARELLAAHWERNPPATEAP